MAMNTELVLASIETATTSLNDVRSALQEVANTLSVAHSDIADHDEDDESEEAISETEEKQELADALEQCELAITDLDTCIDHLNNIVLV
jgi:hypothetical protein